MKQIGLLILFSWISWSIQAQTIFQPKQMEYDFKGLVYETEKAFELIYYPNGLAVAYSFGRLESYYKTTYYRIEFGTLKDGRERRQNKNINFASEGLSSAFTYGKRNSIFMIKVSSGRKRYLTEKAKRKGVSVGLNYNYGLSLVLLKPYHLRLVDVNQADLDNILVTQPYSEENHDLFLRYNDIFGGAGYFTGIGGTNVTVGGHAKAALHFAFGAFDQKVRAIDVGFMIDAFPRRLPILVERENIRNKYIHLNLFISAHFGRRK